MSKHFYDKFPLQKYFKPSSVNAGGEDNQVNFLTGQELWLADSKRAILFPQLTPTQTTSPLDEVKNKSRALLRNT